MPDLSTVHRDVFLTNLSIARRQLGLIADQVAPPVPVSKPSDRYVIFDNATFLQSSGLDKQNKPQSVRRPGTLSTEVDYKLSSNAFYAEQYAKNFPIYDRLKKYADSPIMVDMTATRVTTDRVRLDIEVGISKMLCTRANYPSAGKVQLSNGSTSWAYSSSTPISTDLLNGKNYVFGACQMPANKLIVNYTSAQVLSQNPDYLNRIRYAGEKGLTYGGLFPLVFGLEPIEARPQYLTSAEGVTETFGMVWVDDQGENIAIVAYVNDTMPSLWETTLALQFDAEDDTINTHDFAIARWREENRQLERVECRVTRDWAPIAVDGSTNGWNSNGYIQAGYLISGTNL